MTSEARIRKMLSHIHAMAKHLLGLEELSAMDLFVAVQPLGSSWRVKVSYAGFDLERKAIELEDALDLTLEHLTMGVMKRIEDGNRLLSELEVESK